MKGKRDSSKRAAPPDEDDIDEGADAGDGRRYRAPALEKGLDILELLASESQPMAVSAIVQRLGRSTGELFRMIQVLRGGCRDLHQGGRQGDFGRVAARGLTFEPTGPGCLPKR